MDFTTLVTIIAATLCVLLLLYGAWLCLDETLRGDKAEQSKRKREKAAEDLEEETNCSPTP